MLPTIKSDFEPTESNVDEFRPIRNEREDSGGRRSNGSFAEEVEKEISMQDFRAKKAAEDSRPGSKASDAKGNQERGRPRESEIDKISVTQNRKKSQSGERGNSLSSLGKGSHLNRDPAMPFIDEKLSNINDSRAFIPKQNEKLNTSNLETIANVFDQIDPKMNLKNNIHKLNDSLAEAE